MFINILLIIFIIMIIAGCLRKKSCGEFLLKNRTDAIKGIAAIMIVFSHMLSFSSLISHNLIGGGYTSRIFGIWGGVGVALFFILSGFGCWFSTTKIVKDWRIVVRWFIYHVERVFIFYIIAFIVVVVLQMVIYHVQINIGEYAKNFFTLTIPGTSTWYLKVQLLFYVFITLSIMTKKEHRLIILYVLTMVYAIVAWNIGLPDYWWKTSMCFPIGYTVAEKNLTIVDFLKKKRSILILIGVVCISYLGILLDRRYVFLLQLTLWSFLAVSIVLLAQRLLFENMCFQFVGRTSLSLYLVHIGTVSKAMGEESNVGIFIFIVVVIIGTFITEFLARRIYKYCSNNRRGY